MPVNEAGSDNLNASLNLGQYFIQPQGVPPFTAGPILDFDDSMDIIEELTRGFCANPTLIDAAAINTLADDTEIEEMLLWAVDAIFGAYKTYYTFITRPEVRDEPVS